MNDVLQKQQNKPFTPNITVPKKNLFLVLPYLGPPIVAKKIMSCINKFYGCVDLRVIFLSIRRIKSFCWKGNCFTLLRYSMRGFRYLIDTLYRAFLRGLEVCSLSVSHVESLFIWRNTEIFYLVSSKSFAV